MTGKKYTNSGNYVIDYILVSPIYLHPLIPYPEPVTEPVVEP